jgi:hypothetical protein
LFLPFLRGHLFLRPSPRSREGGSVNPDGCL